MIYIFIINALVILGIYNAFQPTQIFGFINMAVLNKYAKSKYSGLVVQITKPIYGCFVCMPSVWGTIGFIWFAPYTWYYFPIYVFALSGLMWLLKELIYD